MEFASHAARTAAIIGDVCWSFVPSVASRRFSDPFEFYSFSLKADNWQRNGVKKHTPKCKFSFSSQKKYARRGNFPSTHFSLFFSDCLFAAKLGGKNSISTESFFFLVFFSPRLLTKSHTRTIWAGSSHGENWEIKYLNGSIGLIFTGTHKDAPKLMPKDALNHMETNLKGFRWGSEKGKSSLSDEVSVQNWRKIERKLNVPGGGVEEIISRARVGVSQVHFSIKKKVESR